MTKLSLSNWDHSFPTNTITSLVPMHHLIKAHDIVYTFAKQTIVCENFGVISKHSASNNAGY